MTGQPERKQALAMPLVAPHFENLAGPPSLASCTRDVYAPDTRLTLPALLRLASGVASAALHLHQVGLSHGDLYAHNILHTTDGRALLGDFGAAGFFDMTDMDAAHALQRLEVRAFGHLLGELLALCDTRHEPPANTAIGQALQQLSAQCCSETPSQRPLFAAITVQLLNLTAIFHKKTLTTETS